VKYELKPKKHLSQLRQTVFSMDYELRLKKNLTVGQNRL